MIINLCEFSSYVDEDGFINEDIIDCLGLSAWETEMDLEEDLSDFWDDPLVD